MRSFPHARLGLYPALPKKQPSNSHATCLSKEYMPCSGPSHKGAYKADACLMDYADDGFLTMMTVMILDAANSFWGGGAGMVVQGWVIVGAVMAMVSHGQNEAERQSVRLTPGVTPNHTGVGSPVFTGILLGIGIAGFIDESVFHQLLQWHTFY